MKKYLSIVGASVSAVLILSALAGCGGNMQSPNNTNTTASSSVADSTTANAKSPILSSDGVEIISIAFEIVGNTPNFQVVFANNTSENIDFDLSKFKFVLAGGNEIDAFHLTKKTINAQTPYSQSAFTATPGSLKVGDVICVSYDNRDLGTYEVGNF